MPACDHQGRAFTLTPTKFTNLIPELIGYLAKQSVFEPGNIASGLHEI